MTSSGKNKWRFIAGLSVLILLGFSNVTLFASLFLARNLGRTLWALGIALVVPVLLLAVWTSVRRLLSLRRIKALVSDEVAVTAVPGFLKSQKYSRLLGVPGVLLLSETEVQAWACPAFSKSKLLHTVPYTEVAISLHRLKTFRPCYALVVKSKAQASMTFRAIPTDALLWQAMPMAELSLMLQQRLAFTTLLPDQVETKPLSKHAWRHIVFLGAYSLMVLTPWLLQSLVAVDGYHAAQKIRANEAHTSASVTAVQKVTSVSRYGGVNNAYTADYAFTTKDGQRISAKEVPVYEDVVGQSSIAIAYDRAQPDYSMPIEGMDEITIVTPLGIIVVMTGLLTLIYLYFIVQVRG